jgi:outer membrane lipoprotein-sorting protein
MVSIIISVLIAAQTPSTGGEDMLNKMAQRYSSAQGIQWTMQSRIYQPVFDEVDISPVQFIFNPPDTFYFKSNTEEVVGIADTVWLLSVKNRQIQKRITEPFLMPTDFIINWNQRYTLKDFLAQDDGSQFNLEGKGGVTPSKVRLTLNKNNHIKEIYYKDVSDNDVTLTISKERLKRSTDINLIYLHIPQGYKLIDLTE